MYNLFDDPDISAIIEHGMKPKEFKKLKFLYTRWKNTEGLTDEAKHMMWVVRGWYKDAEAIVELSTKAQKVLDKWHLQTYGRPIPGGETENLY